ncbi:hypothetical protein LXL04_014970 [Taraxacum kok-saghyz]
MYNSYRSTEYHRATVEQVSTQPEFESSPRRNHPQPVATQFPKLRGFRAIIGIRTRENPPYVFRPRIEPPTCVHTETITRCLRPARLDVIGIFIYAFNTRANL